MSNIATNLSGAGPKYTIKCKSPCNFICRSLLNDNFPVVWAVNNVKGLHAFFKRIQWSESKENSMYHKLHHISSCKQGMVKSKQQTPHKLATKAHLF